MSDWPEGFRAGFVCVVGRPNTGKSTLTNALVGQKVAITSDRPETTRRVVRAIVNREGGQLILVDGGLAQVNAAQRVVEETGADVRIAGLAKRLEEVWVPGEEFPVILPRTSPALRLLQQLRDESHRFAIAFHRRKRSKAMTRSSLDAVAGLGPAKQKALLAAFGSVAKIKRATVEDLESVRGIGPSLARAIVEHFRSGASDPGARPVA